jgi:Caspase domain
MPVPKPTLYCIVAINVADISIGPACTVDRNRITGFFKKLTDFIELPYKEIQIDNKDFTVDGVKTAIKSIDPASNDIVVFAYSGHGFRFNNETGLFPQLGLFTNKGLTQEIIRENTINLEEIFNLVRAKGARLNIVPGDCCNNELSMQHFEVTLLNLQSWPTEWQRKHCSQLFEKGKGSYLAAAASKGQLAACNKVEGGFFTFSFFQFLESAFEAGNTGLDGIINRAAEFASVRSGRAICGDKPCMQNAIFRTVA